VRHSLTRKNREQNKKDDCETTSTLRKVKDRKHINMPFWKEESSLEKIATEVALTAASLSQLAQENWVLLFLVAALLVGAVVTGIQYYSNSPFGWGKPETGTRGTKTSKATTAEKDAQEWKNKQETADDVRRQFVMAVLVLSFGVLAVIVCVYSIGASVTSWVVVVVAVFVTLRVLFAGNRMVAAFFMWLRNMYIGMDSRQTTTFLIFCYAIIPTVALGKMGSDILGKGGMILFIGIGFILTFVVSAGPIQARYMYIRSVESKSYITMQGTDPSII